MREKDIKEIGWYWWLPECFKEFSNNSGFWSIIYVSSTYEDELIDRVGRFIGPLKPPIGIE